MFAFKSHRLTTESTTVRMRLYKGLDSKYFLASWARVSITTSHLGRCSGKAARQQETKSVLAATPACDSLQGLLSEARGVSMWLNENGSPHQTSAVTSLRRESPLMPTSGAIKRKKHYLSGNKRYFL